VDETARYCRRCKIIINTRITKRVTERWLNRPSLVRATKVSLVKYVKTFIKISEDLHTRLNYYSKREASIDSFMSHGNSDNADFTNRTVDWLVCKKLLWPQLVVEKHEMLSQYLV
jgi:hypothetical protein